MYPNPTGGYLERSVHLPSKRQKTYHEELIDDIKRIANRKRPKPKEISKQKEMVRFGTRRYRRPRGSKRRGVIRRRLPRSLTTRNKIIRCRLVDSFQATHAAGAMERYLISMTNIVDPFGGGSAQQPLGYDQWKTLYSKAKILGAKVKMTVHNAGTAEPIMMGMNPRYPNASATLADWEYNVEVAGSKSRLLSQDVDHGFLVMARSTKKMMDLKNIKDADDIECNIATDTGPTDTAYIEAWTQPFDKTIATAADIIVQVDYIVLLYDPIIPSRSTA